MSFKRGLIVGLLVGVVSCYIWNVGFRSGPTDDYILKTVEQFGLEVMTDCNKDIDNEVAGIPPEVQESVEFQDVLTQARQVCANLSFRLKIVLEEVMRSVR